MMRSPFGSNSPNNLTVISYSEDKKWVVRSGLSRFTTKTWKEINVPTALDPGGLA
jgi:hypothetical protein